MSASFVVILFSNEELSVIYDEVKELKSDLIDPDSTSKKFNLLFVEAVYAFNSASVAKVLSNDELKFSKSVTLVDMLEENKFNPSTLLKST